MLLTTLKPQRPKAIENWSWSASCPTELGGGGWGDVICTVIDAREGVRQSKLAADMYICTQTTVIFKYRYFAATL